MKTATRAVSLGVVFGEQEGGDVARVEGCWGEWEPWGRPRSFVQKIRKLGVRFPP